MNIAALLLLLGITPPPEFPPPPPAPKPQPVAEMPRLQNPALQPLLEQAEAGNADAQFDLGTAYYNGDTGNVDYDQARRWWEKAAARGDKIAQYNLGTLYDEGRGVSQNHRIAAQWYRDAAQQGYAYAQYNLGNLYRDGKGVPQNAYIARDWQEKAAAQGDRDAMYVLGSLYRQGALGISGDGQHTLAFYWLEQAAMRGNPQAQNELAGLYARGEGVAQNEETALKWWQAAADLGDRDAIATLARRYQEGEHNAVMREQLARWYREAIEDGDHTVYGALGQLYAEAVPPDYDAAMRWWQTGARQGDRDAQYRLARFYYYLPDGRQISIAQIRNAFSTFVQDCDNGETPPDNRCADAAYHLALINQYGFGFADETRLDEARKNWQQAAVWGHPVARAWQNATQKTALLQSLREPAETPEETASIHQKMEKRAENGDRDIQFLVGMDYFHRGEYDDARRWLQKAANRGNIAAPEVLTVIDALQHPDHPPKTAEPQAQVQTAQKQPDPPRDAVAETAELQQRAEAGDARAQYQLSFRYRQGDGVKQDQKEANYCLKRAENEGDADAQYWLGLRYYDGWMGFRKDKVAAHVWLDKAAAHGDPDIQFHVGWRYYFNKDYDDARRWLQPIADSNSIHADMAARLLDSINFLQGKKRPPPTTSPTDNTASPATRP